ncbi:MAG: cytidylate kinase-like family protein [Bacteroidales bacterium]|nr:cytidylate kinase-like family protein [Bacteroidales bacterium]
MSHRLIESFEIPEKHKSTEPGPVITISREYGCPSKDIAKALYEKIQESYVGSYCPWKIISKEIIQLSADKLNIPPSKIAYVFKDVSKGMMEEMIESLSTRYYQNDKKIKKIIIEVIAEFGRQGNVIILGRGSVSVTRNIKSSLHIRLAAPVQWRVERLAQRKNLSTKELTSMALQMDENRWRLIREMGQTSADIHIFDAVFNCATMSVDEISSAILSLASQKNMLNVIKG